MTKSLAELDKQIHEDVCDGDQVQEVKWFPVREMNEFKLLGVEQTETAERRSVEQNWQQNWQENQQMWYQKSGGVDCEVGQLQMELESVKKDNAALIEMNFNLEQQVSALKEDLEEANEACEEWEEKCGEFEERADELDSRVQDLLESLNSIEEMAANR